MPSSTSNMTMPPPPVSAPCPVCGTPFGWPPAGACRSCGVALDGELATAWFDLARQIGDLRERQSRLTEQLAATAAPSPPPPPVPAAPAPRARLGDLEAQTLLGLAGAALLTVAAIVFAAVTWQQLSDVVRGGVLLAATGAAVATARWLHRRGLAVTAGAVGLLATALTATLVWAAHRYGATGALPDSAGGALALLAAAGTASALAARRIRFQTVAAALGWVSAVALGTLAVLARVPEVVAPAVLLGCAGAAALPSLRVPALAGRRRIYLGAGGAALLVTAATAALMLATTDGVGVWIPVAAGVAAAGCWLVLGPRRVGAALATATVVGIGLGAVATVEPSESGALLGIAVVAFLATLAVGLVPADRRAAVAAGSGPALLPAAVITAELSRQLLAGWVASVGAVWRPGWAPAPPADPLLAVAVGVGAVSTVLLVWVLLRDRGPAGALAVLPVAAAAVAWQAGAEPFVLAVGALALGLAGLTVPAVRRSSGVVRWAAAGWLVASIGWALPIPWLATGVTGLVAAGAGAAITLPIGRRVEQAALVVIPTAVAAASVAVATMGGQATVALVAAPVALLAGAVAAAAGPKLRLSAEVTVAAWVLVATVGSLGTLAADGARTAAVATAIVAAAGGGLAVVWHRRRGVALVYGWIAAGAATGTGWLLLAAGRVTVVEAYTAIPAALALATGAIWMARDTTVRSRVALHPGLALAATPTVVQLLLDPQDTTRAVAVAALATTALLLGAARHLEAPVWHGVGATVALVATQLAVAVGYVPRWVTFAVAGTVLVVASATFERQRIRGRQLVAGARRIAQEFR